MLEHAYTRKLHPCYGVFLQLITFFATEVQRFRNYHPCYGVFLQYSAQFGSKSQTSKVEETLEVFLYISGFLKKILEVFL